MTTSLLTPLEVVSRIDAWKGADVQIEPLGGGITNHNFLVQVADQAHPNGERYVMRIPGEGTEMFIDRGNERSCSIASASIGVSPEVVHVVDDAMVIRFIEGETLHPESLLGRSDRICQAITTLKTVHQRAAFPMQIEPFNMIRRYTEMAREVGAPFPKEMHFMYGVGDEVEAATERDKPEPAACHNDLLSENFLVDTTGRMWIIDWEYGGMTDPFFDLGDFCTEHPFTDAEEQLVLTTYCGEMIEPLYYRMLLYKLVADPWWSPWAMIQVSSPASTSTSWSTASTACSGSTPTRTTPTIADGSQAHEDHFHPALRVARIPRNEVVDPDPPDQEPGVTHLRLARMRLDSG